MGGKGNFRRRNSEEVGFLVSGFEFFSFKRIEIGDNEIGDEEIRGMKSEG